MKNLKELLEITDIHIKRINIAIGELKTVFPLTKSSIENLTKFEFMATESLVHRFEILQNLIGNKVIDAYLDYMQESTQGLTIIDKLNKLEKLEIIESSYIWKEMREARNHISHEYPENPELVAVNMNNIYNLAPKLIAIAENIKASAKL